MYKHILSMILSIMLISQANQTFAQKSNLTTDTITVLGNCGQCKSRIEDAAYIKGVKLATWDKKTKLLKITFNSTKTNMNSITKAINIAGHDTPDHKAADKDYKKLPDCCAYRSGGCHHE